MDERKQEAPAAARNREPILAALRRLLPPAGLVLEVASGTGEHARWFAAALPGLRWQPTETEPGRIDSIAAWREDGGSANLLPPLPLDAAAPDRWPVARADAVVSINMVHIAPWSACLGLLRGAGRVLPPGGLLILYGPFIEAGVATAESNLAFDADLRGRDPAWGLRAVDDVAREAELAGLHLVERVAMPANNLLLAFRRLSLGAAPPGPG